MREIGCDIVAETVSTLFQEACYSLPDDVLSAISMQEKLKNLPSHVTYST